MVKVTYIEDEPSIRQNYTEILEEAGHTVVSLAAPPPVSELLEQPLPDLFLLDVSFGQHPDEGFDLCTALMQLAPEARVAFLTTRTDPADVSLGLSLGAVAYIAKDEPVKALLECIDQVSANSPNA